MLSLTGMDLLKLVTHLDNLLKETCWKDVDSTTMFNSHTSLLSDGKKRTQKPCLHSYKTKKRTLTSVKENVMAIWELQCTGR